MHHLCQGTPNLGNKGKNKNTKTASITNRLQEDSGDPLLTPGLMEALQVYLGLCVGSCTPSTQTQGFKYRRWS